MIPLYFIFRSKKRLTFQQVLSIAILGIIGFGINNITLNYGEVVVDASISSFLVAQAPVMTVILAIIFLKEKLNKLTWFGFLVSFIGVLLIAINGKHMPHFNFAILFFAINVIASGIFTILQKPLLKEINAIELTALAMWSGTLVLLIYAGQLWHELPHVPFSATIAGVYLGIFPSVIGFSLWAMALRKTSATKAVSCLYMMPILTTAIGYLWLNEIPQLISFMGGMVALCGAILVHISKPKEFYKI